MDDIQLEGLSRAKFPEVQLNASMLPCPVTTQRFSFMLLILLCNESSLQRVQTFKAGWNACPSGSQGAYDL
jgi:hypothetical protein